MFHFEYYTPRDYKQIIVVILRYLVSLKFGFFSVFIFIAAETHTGRAEFCSFYTKSPETIHEFKRPVCRLFQFQVHYCKPRVLNILVNEIRTLTRAFYSPELIN
jgi:Fe-S-cluster containining protein